MVRIFVFQKWFTVTKLNGCLIPEDGRSFWKRNQPLFPGPCGNPAGRDAWGREVFLWKANLAAGRDQKEELGSERCFEIPGWG